MHLAAQNGHILIVKFINELTNSVIVNAQGKLPSELVKDRLVKMVPRGKRISEVKSQKGTLLDNLKGIWQILIPNEA